VEISRPTAAATTNGRVNARHRAAATRPYRIIDGSAPQDGAFPRGRVDRIRPNRTFARAVAYLDCEKRYILCAAGLGVGDRLLSVRVQKSARGTRCRCALPVGTVLAQLRLRPGVASRGRSAGTAVSLMPKRAKR